MDESIDQYLGIGDSEEPSIEEFDSVYTVELTGNCEVLRMTGVMNIDEQTCSFEELTTRQLLLRTGPKAPGLRRSKMRDSVR